MTDRRRRAATAALSVALLVAAGCASPGPVVEGGASERAADSQVRDTPLVAAHHATTPRPPSREDSNRSGQGKLFQIASPGRLPATLALAARVLVLAPAARPRRAFVLLPGSPRGPPAT